MDDLISRQALCEYALNQKDKSVTPNDIMRFPSAQPEVAKDTNVPNNDCISRQAAIDAVNEWLKLYVINRTMSNITSIQDILRQLPSAQQERILYANMSDAEFEKWLYEHGICNPNIHESIPCDAVPLLIDNAISELPSAQLEQKKGEWIPVTNGRGGFECDQCHNYAPSYQDGVEWLSDFCPNCGADMRGEQDG